MTAWTDSRRTTASAPGYAAGSTAGGPRHADASCPAAVAFTVGAAASGGGAGRPSIQRVACSVAASERLAYHPSTALAVSAASAGKSCACGNACRSNGTPTGSKVNVFSPSDARTWRVGLLRASANAWLPRKYRTQSDGLADDGAASARKSAGVTRGPGTCKTGWVPCCPPCPQAMTRSGSLPFNESSDSRRFDKTVVGNGNFGATDAGFSTRSVSDFGAALGAAK